MKETNKQNILFIYLNFFWTNYLKGDLVRDEVMPVLGISSLAVDLSFKEKNEQRDSNNLLNFCKQAEQTESAVCDFFPR